MTAIVQAELSTCQGYFPSVAVQQLGPLQAVPQEPDRWPEGLAQDDIEVTHRSQQMRTKLLAFYDGGRLAWLRLRAGASSGCGL